MTNCGPVLHEVFNIVVCVIVLFSSSAACFILDNDDILIISENVGVIGFVIFLLCLILQSITTALQIINLCTKKCFMFNGHDDLYCILDVVKVYSVGLNVCFSSKHLTLLHA